MASTRSNNSECLYRACIVVGPIRLRHAMASTTCVDVWMQQKLTEFNVKPMACRFPVLDKGNMGSNPRSESGVMGEAHGVAIHQGAEADRLKPSART
jgi:hypothetical protein